MCTCFLLKETYYSQFQIHNFILGYTYHWFTCLCCSSVALLWLKHSILAPPTSWTPILLIGQLTHAWPSTANNNRAAVLNKFLCAKLAARYKFCKYKTRWGSVMSQSHRIKPGEVFQEQCFLWERGASVGVDLVRKHIVWVFQCLSLLLSTWCEGGGENI